MQEIALVMNATSLGIILYIIYYRIRHLEKHILNGQVVERLARVEEKVNILYDIIIGDYDNKLQKR